MSSQTPRLKSHTSVTKRGRAIYKPPRYYTTSSEEDIRRQDSRSETGHMLKSVAGMMNEIENVVSMAKGKDEAQGKSSSSKTVYINNGDSNIHSPLATIHTPQEIFSGNHVDASCERRIEQVSVSSSPKNTSSTGNVEFPNDAVHSDIPSLRGMVRGRYSPIPLAPVVTQNSCYSNSSSISTFLGCTTTRHEIPNTIPSFVDVQSTMSYSSNNQQKFDGNSTLPLKYSPTDEYTLHELRGPQIKSVEKVHVELPKYSQRITAPPSTYFYNNPSDMPSADKTSTFPIKTLDQNSNYINDETYRPEAITSITKQTLNESAKITDSSQVLQLHNRNLLSNETVAVHSRENIIYNSSQPQTIPYQNNTKPANITNSPQVQLLRSHGHSSPNKYVPVHSHENIICNPSITHQLQNFFRQFEQKQETQWQNILQQVNQSINERNRREDIIVHSYRKPPGFPLNTLIEFDEFIENPQKQRDLLNFLAEVGGRTCQDALNQYVSDTMTPFLCTQFTWTKRTVPGFPNMRSLFDTEMGNIFFNALLRDRNLPRPTHTEYGRCMQIALRNAKQRYRDAHRRRARGNNGAHRLYEQEMQRRYGHNNLDAEDDVNHQ